MSFKYACFLSYRATSEPGIWDLYHALRKELAQQTQLYLPNLEVYLDRERMQGGDYFNDQLAHAICRSVCMVVLFSPRYFDLSHTTCAREYSAMVELEQTRLAKLNCASRPSLIIPLIIRGKLPEAISSERHSYSLSEILLAAPDLRRKPARQIFRSIADVIYERYEQLQPLEDELCGGCEQFGLPDEAKIMPWLRDMVQPPQIMPWR